jgi:DNA-binding beta-propeller fold protein YncE
MMFQSLYTIFRTRSLAAALLAVAASPLGMLAQQPNLLVLNKIKSQANLVGNLAFVDLASGNVIARVPVGREPHEVAASPDDKYAVVSNTGSYTQPGNTLSVIDIAAQKEIHRVDLGPLLNPHGIVAHDGLFFFTAEGARAIAAYDPATNRLSWIMGTGQDHTHLLVFSKDGRTMVTTNRGSDTLSLFELTDTDPIAPYAWKETIIPVCRGPEGIDLSPDGKQVWIGCRTANEVGIVDIAQKKLIDTFPTHTKALARVRFLPDGKRILVTDLHGGEAIFFDAATHAELKRLKMGTGCEGILLVPGGKKALIGVTNDNNVAEVDLDTMTITRRISTGDGPDGMAWIGK